MPAEPKQFADLFKNPSVEDMQVLTSWESEPLTFELAFDLYAPPVHMPELLDDPERDLPFLRAGDGET